MTHRRETGSKFIAQFLVLVSLLVSAGGFTQSPADTPPGSDAINLFLDSPDYYLDPDYFRTELPFVNYMRDRADADVHILATTQQTGGGGREFTIAFIGLRRFEGQKHTLKYAARPTDSENVIRKELAKYIKIGLVPFVSQSAAVERMDVVYQNPGNAAQAPKPAKDPWNCWTFRASMQSYLNGEKSYKYRYLYSTFSIGRVTEAWKIKANFSISNTKTAYDYGESLSYTDIQSSNSLSGSVVRSLTPHWSCGIRTSAYKSTYNNYDLSLSLSPGMEYNVFPYSESTRRQLRVQYLVAGEAYDYHEETIYLKTAEQKFSEQLNLVYELKQPWGTVQTSLYSSHYLDDMKKFEIQWDNSVSLRLFKGLSFDCYGYLTFLRNQISLQRRGASVQEVLLRRRELETSYNYYLSLGFSYTWGSIYNNVVNPRFGW
jgi:hypothetical protein